MTGMEAPAGHLGSEAMATRPKFAEQPDTSLEAALVARLRDPLDVGRVNNATVSLDIEDGDGWTLHIEDSQLRLGHGVVAGADTTIITDSATMTGILTGTTSGVHAFISGQLRVRGNLALSLRLAGSIAPEDRPVRFPRARDVKAGGVDTFVLEAGAGPPVVLLHGLGATNSSMLPPLWDLATDYRVVAPDLPGFGDSGKPIRSYDAGYFGRWVIELLDELGIERAHLVGNSLGGRISVEAALLAPERIDRLVLLAPSSAFIRKREWSRVVKLLRPEMALLPVPLAHRHIVRSTKALFSRSNRLPESWYAAAADEFLRVFSTARGRIAFFSAARQIYLEEPYGEEGFWDRLCGLSRPALFVWGERDRLVPAKFARHVEQALPEVESVVLEDCGHVPQFEHPDRTNELIREFLGR